MQWNWFCLQVKPILLWYQINIFKITVQNNNSLSVLKYILIKKRSLMSILTCKCLSIMCLSVKIKSNCSTGYIEKKTRFNYVADS